MAVEVKKGKSESPTTFLYRFTKRVRHSGILKETKKRRFTNRPQNKNKRRAVALYRVKKQEEIARMKKYGYR